MDELYLPRKLRYSLLQRRILSYLEEKPETSITLLAKSIGHLRESVSRAIHKLEKSGRIYKSTNGYELTIWGKEECAKNRKFIPANNVTYHWQDAMVCFDCPCGNEEIILSDESGNKKCDCGRIYKFTAKLEVLCGSE